MKVQIKNNLQRDIAPKGGIILVKSQTSNYYVGVLQNENKKNESTVMVKKSNCSVVEQ